MDARAKEAKRARDNGAKSKTKNSFDVSKNGCYYCLEYRHFSSDCEKRKEDRDTDIWRPTVKDPKMFKGRVLLPFPGREEQGEGDHEQGADSAFEVDHHHEIEQIFG